MAPRLSVVVPVYNVERYLEECLDSIAAQTFADFECVMVDDGSTDSSAAIAEAYAAKDARFRLVRQQNKGLGAARNTGWRNLAEGTEYLTFVDSDDTVPPHAYQLMIGTLDETGSDFACGNVLRFRSVGYYQSGAHVKPFRETRLKTHVTALPALVTDRTAWNKVYRRSFFDGAGILYPEGILYEDAPVSVPHHYLAGSVDVLSDHIYHWREREAGEVSITQMHTNPRAWWTGSARWSWSASGCRPARSPSSASTWTPTTTTAWSRRSRCSSGGCRRATRTTASSTRSTSAGCSGRSASSGSPTSAAARRS
ncbi:glycosyltransferase family 2 protein [Kitasatospora acidiphila]|uniref:Glycosyltransferase family 2 protein n=1 Tax=Kitasatospora acidiphila TaxID=2567942 RepID=A0A540VZU6_9ACTN|nr:glycosyltransferase family 2 protein [Kitasatospora acidiphila]